MGTGDDINSFLGFNPLQYTRGQAGNGTSTQGINSLAPLDLAPLGSVVVEALNGSTVSGFHGDVTVIANTGQIDVTGYSTPEDVSTPDRRGRDRRFAGIGHGGSSFSFWTEGSGYIGIDGVMQERLSFGRPEVMQPERILTLRLVHARRWVTSGRIVGALFSS